MRTCPLCLKESEPLPVGVFGEYKMYLCDLCGVEYADPFKAPGAGWYEESQEYEISRVISREMEWYHLAALRFLEPRGSLLDIGFGTGIFLDSGHKAGFDVWGIDFARKNIEVAKARYGLDKVYCLSAADLKKKFSNRKFEVVTFFEVLEHLDGPAQFLEDVKGLLTPDGVIVMSVPNRDRFIDSLGRCDGPPNHLTRWSAGALKGFLERAGFDVSQLVEKTFDASDVMNLLRNNVRLGVASGLMKKGLADGEDGKGKLRKAAGLMTIKTAVFKAAALLPGLLLSLLRLRGGCMLAIARIKKENEARLSCSRFPR